MAPARAAGPASSASQVAGVLALFVLACGVVNILSALVWIDPTRLHWLRQNLPLEVTLGSRSLTALAGLLEIALSWSLLRRKRQGWLIATVLLGGSAVLHLFKGLDVEEAAISAAAGLALLAYRRQFTVRSDPFGWAQALRAAVFFALGTCAYGVLGLWLLRRHFTPDFSLGAALQTTLAQLSSLAPLSLTPRDNSHTARWLLDSLDAAAIAAVVYTAGLFFQPVADRVGGAQHGAREAVLAILRRHGAQPQAYFLLMPGLTYMFSPSRQSVLGYRVIGGVAVVLRDPCGPDMEVPALLVAFRDRCHAHDWLPCFLSATQRWLPQLLGLGWHCMKIGEEALLDLPGLAFTGKRWQDVRTALHRLPREGYRAEWYDLIADPRGWLPELERISEIWLAQQRGGEMGFTLGTWELAVEHAAEQRLLVLVDPQDQPAAFMSFIPCFVPGGGWSLDLMRKARSLPPGGMEYLLATAIQAFQAEGMALLSLSLAPLADISPDDPFSDAPEVLERGRQLIFDYFGLTYNFRGLAAFKAKFSPRWEPRYLVYPSLVSLPRVLLALLRAHRAK